VRCGFLLESPGMPILGMPCKGSNRAEWGEF
jgi:hypothetical protein